MPGTATVHATLRAVGGESEYVQLHYGDLVELRAYFASQPPLEELFATYVLPALSLERLDDDVRGDKKPAIHGRTG